MISTNENFLYYFSDSGLQKISLEKKNIEKEFYATKKVYHHNGQPFFVQEEGKLFFTIHNGSLEIIDLKKIEKKYIKMSKNIRSVYNLKAASSNKLEVFLCDSKDEKTSYIRSYSKKSKFYKFDKNPNFKNFHVGTIEGSQLCYMIYSCYSNIFIKIISLSTGKLV